MNLLQRTIVATTALALLGLWSSSAFAQGPPGLQYTPTPQLSPYLNLFANTGPGSAYASQLYVRPQLEQYAYNNQAASALNSLQQQLTTLRSSSGFGANGLTPAGLRPTGHASNYMDYGHYYSPGLRAH